MLRKSKDMAPKEDCTKKILFGFKYVVRISLFMEHEMPLKYMNVLSIRTLIQSISFAVGFDVGRRNAKQLGKGFRQHSYVLLWDQSWWTISRDA